MKAALFRSIDGISWFLQVGGIVALAFMALTVSYDALMRYAFAAPTSWSLEVNSFLVVYLALMTAADVERRGEHIGITLLPDSMGPIGRKLLLVVVSLVGIVFSSILAWRGWHMAYDAWIYGERVSSAFGTPNWIPYSMFPIGFGMLALQFLLNLVRPTKEKPSEVASHV
ncbi:TRAP transporter small permease [Fulvimarina endophytica]|uniref:TRAP transporter small permease protein n=1 Tax=Fulvimarina endophytica TaxID=2293836 RepID=A0A371X0W6_9HYPH|nr:TRAP transporter small permease [Fulvimarina endophytica]RFC62872.1 TRAP transporter small permease [Fulvimarina endophytica]